MELSSICKNSWKDKWKVTEQNHNYNTQVFVF